MNKIDGVFRLTKRKDTSAKSKKGRAENFNKGKEGEFKAAEYLSKIGYDIVEINYSAGNAEIDLICKDKDFLVFVEVKCKSTKKYGMGFEEVSKNKQKKIISCAKLYMRDSYINTNTSVRFDIISIDEGKILHIKNAFSDA